MTPLLILHWCRTVHVHVCMYGTEYYVYSEYMLGEHYSVNSQVCVRGADVSLGSQVVSGFFLVTFSGALKGQNITHSETLYTRHFI